MRCVQQPCTRPRFGTRRLNLETQRRHQPLLSLTVLNYFTFSDVIQYCKGAVCLRSNKLIQNLRSLNFWRSAVCYARSLGPAQLRVGLIEMERISVPKSLLGSLVSALLLLSGSALAQSNPTVIITVDENGHGFIQTPFGGAATTGTLQPDPGPGGLPAALTYNLLGPPSLVAGDVPILDPGGLTLSDDIRFNAAGTGGVSAYPASLVFYSDNSHGVNSLADTGFPTAPYTNVVFETEVISGGTSGLTYTPGPNDPGYVAGFNVTYNITSDTTVPEPASASLILAAAGLLLAGKRRLKARANYTSQGCALISLNVEL